MKKKIFLLLIGILFVIQTTFAQTDKYIVVEKLNRSEVKLNSLILLGIINPAIEAYATEHTSLQLEAIGIFYPRNFLWTGEPLTLVSAFLEYRYYFKANHHGFFLGPNAGIGVFRMSKGVIPIIGDSYDGSGTLQYGYNMMLGLDIGYKFNLSEYCFLEICFSPGYQVARYEGFTSDRGMYVGLNKSGEWLPAYKGGVSLNFKL
ncbi:MAG: DUF3575 domain-containing protein [Bacteroidales bacterium]